MARWENTHIVRQEENVPPKQALSVPLPYECGGSHAKVWYETAGGKSKLGEVGSHRQHPVPWNQGATAN